jgi:hypothetical protein
MPRRDLLTEAERRLLFGVPVERDALARAYTLDPDDLALVQTQRTPASRLGFAAVLALLRHPGLAPSMLWPPPDELVAFLAGQLGLPSASLADYTRRPQTLSDHTRDLAAALGLRMPTSADVPLMIEAAAQVA